MSNQTIIISAPFREASTAGRFNVLYTIDGKGKTVWYQVDRQWEGYVCTERNDASLLAVLHWAMVNGYDIECEAPISEELFYKLNETLIPALCVGSKRMYPAKIKCHTASDDLLCENAVGGV